MPPINPVAIDLPPSFFITLETLIPFPAGSFLTSKTRVTSILDICLTLTYLSIAGLRVRVTIAHFLRV